ncbi:hypothetical protein LJR118_004463 [Acidovorax sp. LjRoot118]|uniref:hypothetical protein n=1 Tax=unclassified Acidovorax TaxID=2684926 RepID=UPI0012F9BB8C|nr:hypothetical protein [Acidovorax sp. Root217]
MFAVIELAGQRAAVMMSLVQSARVCRRERCIYLRDVLKCFGRSSTAASRTYSRILGSPLNTVAWLPQDKATGRCQFTSAQTLQKISLLELLATESAYPGSGVIQRLLFGVE